MSLAEDKTRQKMQLAFVLILVSMSIALPAWYVIEVGIQSDDELVKTILVGAWTLTIAGAGMAFSQIGLGRKVS
jgi:hypothetical protein